MDSCILHCTYCLVWHKKLGKCFLFHGLKPCEIRLVVSIYTSHQLYVRPILICQVPVPCLSKIPAPPCPLLLARGYVMIRNMQDSGLLLIIITAHKVKLALLRHIRSRYRNILIPRYIHTGAVIMFIIFTSSNWEPGYIPLAVIHHRMHIRRKNRLGMVVYWHRRVGPPKECLRSRSPIVQLAPDFNIRFSRIQGKAGFPLCSIHLVYITDPARLRAVLILYQHIIHR